MKRRKNDNLTDFQTQHTCDGIKTGKKKNSRLRNKKDRETK